MKRVFLNPDGKIRSGWRMAIGAAVYLGVFYGVLYGLAAVFGALFGVWNLTTANLPYAPMWAQLLVSRHADYCYAAAYFASALAGGLVSVRLNKSVVPSSMKPMFFGGTAGIAMGAVLTLVVLGLDSMRLETEVSRISLSAGLLIVLGKLSGEVLTKRLIFDSLNRRWAKYAAACAAALVLTADWTNAFGVINALLFAVAGCALYERGGLRASAALQIGWTLWTTTLFAWPDVRSDSVYRLYQVSEAWLTGGENALNGFGFTIGCLVILTALFGKELCGILRGEKK